MVANSQIPQEPGSPATAQPQRRLPSGKGERGLLAHSNPDGRATQKGGEHRKSLREQRNAFVARKQGSVLPYYQPRLKRALIR